MDLTEALAIDCEMVGVGPRGSEDQLARVSIVNENLKCIYDRYVKPVHVVIDYRTPISGIRKQDLIHGQDFDTVREEVRSMIEGRLLVGHSVDHDLRVLKLSHPDLKTRDTALFLGFHTMNRNRTPSLKFLARRILSCSIQNGEHSSVDDAKAVMRIYKTVAREWKHVHVPHSESSASAYFDYDDDYFGNDNYDDFEDDYFGNDNYDDFENNSVLFW